MIWLGAIVSLCYVPGVTGAYIATQWPVLAVLLSFGLLQSGPFTVFHVLGLLFLKYAVFLMSGTPTPYSSVFGLWLIFIMALSVWFGTTLESVRDLYKGLAIGAAVSSFLGVLQFLGSSWPPSASTNPMVGLYANSVQQGTVLALVAVALASERMWLWTLPLVPGIVLANSRGAWLALAVGLLGCYFRRIWVLGVLGVAGVAYLSMTLGTSDQVRMLIWSTAWENLTLFGWGPGVFFTILIPRDGAQFYPEYAHNDALQLVFEYGIGAALPLAIVGFALCRTSVREWPLVLAFVVAGCYSMPLWMPIASFLGLVAVGRVLRDYGLAGGDLNNIGRHVVPWQCGDTGACCEPVSVASHHQEQRG